MTSQSRDHWSVWCPWLVTTVVVVVALSTFINILTTTTGDVVGVKTVSVQLAVITQLITTQTELMNRTLTSENNRDVNKQLADIVHQLKQLSESVQVQTDTAVEMSSNIERVYNRLKRLEQTVEHKQNKENLTTLFNIWTQLVLNATALHKQHSSEKFQQSLSDKVQQPAMTSSKISTTTTTTTPSSITVTLESELSLSQQNYSPVAGLTTLHDSYLFVARLSTESIEVYDLETLTYFTKIIIPGLVDPISITADHSSTSLFLADRNGRHIYRLHIFDGEFLFMSIKLTSSPSRISMTAANNLLVTLPSEGRLEEYTATGLLVRQIQLDNSIVNMWHAIDVSDNRYLVSHGGVDDVTHRVCLVDSDGKILKYFGDLMGSSTAQLFTPLYMTRFEDNSILVVDMNNFRIIILDENLEYVETVVQSRVDVDWPYCVWYDSTRQQLLVAYNTLAITMSTRVWINGRITVYDL